MDNLHTDFNQAYWASQPPEIRGLPGIADSQERASRGAELASKGFVIDVPIMVWGWDPYKITAARQSYGYTWVPSAMQDNLVAAPGVSMNGVTPYDPKSAPAGSIAV